MNIGFLHSTKPKKLTAHSLHSEALAMDNGRARLIIFAFGDPHLLECGQTGEDGSTNPHGVLTFWRSNHLDLHRGRCQCSELLGHPLTNSSKHGGATREHNIAIQVFADIHIALHNRLESRVMDATCLLSNKAWLEQHLRAAEALTAHSDDVAIRKLVSLL